MDQHSQDKDATSDDEQRSQAFDRIVSVVHYDDLERSVEREFAKRRRPDDPVEFLCLSIQPSCGSSDETQDNSPTGCLSENPFPDSEAVLHWVNEYRQLERDQIAAHIDSAGSGSLFPHGIVVVADALPENDADAWREETHRREGLAAQGVMVVERSHCTGDSISDPQLMLESMRDVLTMSAGQTRMVQARSGAPSIDWTVNKPGGHGDLYGNQPAHVDPYPLADEDKFNRDVAKRLDTYSKAFQQDLDY